MAAIGPKQSFLERHGKAATTQAPFIRKMLDAGMPVGGHDLQNLPETINVLKRILLARLPPPQPAPVE